MLRTMMSGKSPLPLLMAVLAFGAGSARADLRSQLDIFFQLGPQDSVIAVKAISATVLEVETVDMMTTERRTQAQEVGEKPMAKLLEAAQAQGITTTSH